MYEEVAASYRDVAKGAAADLDRAATHSKLCEGGKGIKKTRVPDDDNAPLIPRGAVISFRSTDASGLRCGTFVFVRFGGQLVIRRFIRAEVTPNALLIHTATQDGRLEKPITPVNLLGQVLKVEYHGESYDPANRSSGVAAFKEYWTEFGTCSPTAKLTRFFAGLLPARMTGGVPKQAPRPTIGQ